MTKTSSSSKKRGYIPVAVCVIFRKGRDPRKRENLLSKSEGRSHSRDNLERVLPFPSEHIRNPSGYLLEDLRILNHKSE